MFKALRAKIGDRDKEVSHRPIPTQHFVDPNIVDLLHVERARNQAELASMKEVSSLSNVLHSFDALSHFARWLLSATYSDGILSITHFDSMRPFFRAGFYLSPDLYNTGLLCNELTGLYSSEVSGQDISVFIKFRYYCVSRYIYAYLPLGYLLLSVWCHLESIRLYQQTYDDQYPHQPQGGPAQVTPYETSIHEQLLWIILRNDMLIQLIGKPMLAYLDFILQFLQECGNAQSLSIIKHFYINSPSVQGAIDRLSSKALSHPANPPETPLDQTPPASPSNHTMQSPCSDLHHSPRSISSDAITGSDTLSTLQEHVSEGDEPHSPCDDMDLQLVKLDLTPVIANTSIATSSTATLNHIMLELQDELFRALLPLHGDWVMTQSIQDALQHNRVYEFIDLNMSFMDSVNAHDVFQNKPWYATNSLVSISLLNNQLRAHHTQQGEPKNTPNPHNTAMLQSTGVNESGALHGLDSPAHSDAHTVTTPRSVTPRHRSIITSPPTPTTSTRAPPPLHLSALQPSYADELTLPTTGMDPTLSSSPTAAASPLGSTHHHPTALTFHPSSVNTHTSGAASPTALPSSPPSSGHATLHSPFPALDDQYYFHSSTAGAINPPVYFHGTLASISSIARDPISGRVLLRNGEPALPLDKAYWQQRETVLRHDVIHYDFVPQIHHVLECSTSGNSVASGQYHRQSSLSQLNPLTSTYSSGSSTATGGYSPPPGNSSVSNNNSPRRRTSFRHPQPLQLKKTPSTSSNTSIVSNGGSDSGLGADAMLSQSSHNRLSTAGLASHATQPRLSFSSQIPRTLANTATAFDDDGMSLDPFPDMVATGYAPSRPRSGASSSSQHPPPTNPSVQAPLTVASFAVGGSNSQNMITTTVTSKSNALAAFLSDELELSGLLLSIRDEPSFIPHLVSADGEGATGGCHVTCDNSPSVPEASLPSPALPLASTRQIENRNTHLTCDDSDDEAFPHPLLHSDDGQLSQGNSDEQINSTAETDTIDLYNAWVSSLDYEGVVNQHGLPSVYGNKHSVLPINDFYTGNVIYPML